MGPPLDGMSLGVAQSARGGGGEPLEQLAVVLVERSGAASLVDDLDRPDGDARATIAVAMMVLVTVVSST